MKVKHEDNAATLADMLEAAVVELRSGSVPTCASIMHAIRGRGHPRYAQDVASLCLGVVGRQPTQVLDKLREASSRIMETCNRRPTSAVCHPSTLRRLAEELGAPWPCEWLEVACPVGMIRVEPRDDVQEHKLLLTGPGGASEWGFHE